MLLSCRFLNDVQNVNSFKYVNQAELFQGDTALLYFQLVDSSVDKPEQGFVPSGRRYMPADGATLSVVLDSIDAAKKLTKTATQPFSQDPSIWAIQIAGSDNVVGTINMRLTLTETIGMSTVVTRALVQCGIRIYPSSETV